MRFVLLGAPGAGKGSLAILIKESRHYLHISTGDILREEIKAESILGKEAKRCIDNGSLVPDQMAMELVKGKLATDECLKRGYMLDGFPRTKKQAEDLDVFLAEVDQPLDYAFYMETDAAMVLIRLTGRRTCRQCGAVFHVTRHPSKVENVCDVCSGELYQREDDEEATIKHRIEVYLKDTRPIVEYYEAQGKLKRLDGNADSEYLHDLMVAIFDAHKKRN